MGLIARYTLNNTLEDSVWNRNISMSNPVYGDGIFGKALRLQYFTKTFPELQNKNVFSCSIWAKVLLNNGINFSNIILFTGKDIDNKSFAIRFDCARNADYKTTSMFFHDNSEGHFCGQSFLDTSFETQYDSWHNYIMVSDGEYLKVYTDGSLKIKRKVKTGSYLDGVVWCDTNINIYTSDIRIYDHALNEKEVHEINKACIIHFDMNDKMIEPTENLWDGAFHYNYNRATGKYSNEANMTVNNKKIKGPYENQVLATVITATTPNTQNWFCPEIWNIQPTAEHPIKIISFWFYSTQGSSITFYDIQGEKSFQHLENGQWINGKTMRFKEKEWVFVAFKIYGALTQSSGCRYFYIGDNSVMTTKNDYWAFYQLQIENDKEYPTPFTNSTRSRSYLYNSSDYGQIGIINNDNFSIIPNSVIGENALKLKSSSTYISVLNDFWPATTENFTYSFWGYFPKISPKTQCLGCCRTSIGVGFAVFIINGILRIDTENQWTTSYAPPENEWIMITIVKNDERKKLYINGQYHSESHATKIMNRLGNVFTFGMSQYNNSGYDNGCYSGTEISDLKLYNKALSSDEIWQEYASGASIDKTGNIYSSNFIEKGKELHTEPMTGNNLSNYYGINSYKITGNTWISDNKMIEIKPNCRYILNFKASNTSGNRFYLGYERFDEDKSSTSNDSCYYFEATSEAFTDRLYQYEYTDIFNATLSTGKKTKYIRLRILNDWEDPKSNSHISYVTPSLIEIPVDSKTRVNKNHSVEAGYLVTNNNKKAKIYKNGKVVSNSFHER